MIAGQRIRKDGEVNEIKERKWKVAEHDEGDYRK